jgi:AbrB family looped-hinge helix DNA binding protein
MTLTISTRGQMVLPSAVRRRHHLIPHSKVEVLDNGKEIILIPLPKDSFKKSRGILTGVSTKDLINLRRLERSREHGR